MKKNDIANFVILCLVIIWVSILLTYFLLLYNYSTITGKVVIKEEEGVGYVENVTLGKGTVIFNVVFKEEEKPVPPPTRLPERFTPPPPIPPEKKIIPEKPVPEKIPEEKEIIKEAIIMPSPKVVIGYNLAAILLLFLIFALFVYFTYKQIKTRKKVKTHKKVKTRKKVKT